MWKFREGIEPQFWIIKLKLIYGRQGKDLHGVWDLTSCNTLQNFTLMIPFISRKCISLDLVMSYLIVCVKVHSQV